jgi:anti-sigma factor (TIGR02949 family)
MQFPEQPLDPKPCVNWVAEHATQDATWEEMDACAQALGSVHEFLHGELSEVEADHIRAHLMACEKCMDDYDIEAMISTMIKRCHPPVAATETLRVRVSRLHVSIA